MKNFSFIASMAFALLPAALPLSALAADPEPSPYEGMPTLTISGTGKSATFSVTPQNLGEEITLKATKGFQVSPAVILPGTAKQTVTVKNLSSEAAHDGLVILKSGNNKTYVHVVGNGTPLAVKQTLPKTDMANKSADAGSNKFTAGNNGYTLEFKLASNDDGYSFCPYVVDANGNGLKLYVGDSEFGYFNARNKRGFHNPATFNKPGGKDRFYNNDGRSHVYRIAVTPDNLAFIYRDGMAIDTLDVSMISPQPEFAAGKGVSSDNLLRNGDFEAGYSFIPKEKILNRLDGWDIVIGDRWNSEQYIDNEEMSADIDNDNHIFRIKPYKWGGGHWGDGSIEQLVDVVPGETYTLNVLAHGGMSAKKQKNTGKISIREAQNSSLKTETELASDTWEGYTLTHTASPECRQLIVSFSVGKGSYNTDIKAVCVDNAQLSGVGCAYEPKYGYAGNNAVVEYVAFDNTGAYAPAAAEIKVTL